MLNKDYDWFVLENYARTDELDYEGWSMQLRSRLFLQALLNNNSVDEFDRVFATYQTSPLFDLDHDTRYAALRSVYVLLATACDGTLATTAQFTSIRVVCNNTLAVALNSGSGAVKVKHSTKFNAQVVKKELGIAVSTWDDFMYRMKGLSERKVKSAEALNYFQEVFAVPAGAPAGYTNERAMAKAMSLYEGAGRGAELSSAKGTAFGLLNAVTEFIDHQRRAKSTDHRLDSAWFGQGAGLKAKAMNHVLQLIR